MKKIIPFTKDIKFNTKIYEISSISLENTLVVDDSGEISGEFIVSGDYKMNDSSINTEPFIYGLPFDITIDDYYDNSSIKIDIDDFKYEIINEEILRVNIDVLLEGKVKIDKEEKEEEKDEINPDVIIDARKELEKKEEIKENKILDEYIGIKKENKDMIEEKDLFKQTEDNTTMVIKEENDNKVTSIFENFSSEDEKYVSYYVHIVRENDTLESISMKYNVSIDDINKYNDNKQITQSSKLIIPYINDDKTI